MIVQADAIAFLDSLPPDSVDLVFFSPPYERARTYGLPPLPEGQAWVDWMVRVFTAARRVCRGMVCCVCQGPNHKRAWSATPALLMADLHRAGFTLREPAIFHRNGVPGSGGKRSEHAERGGGPDDWRKCYEFVVRTTRGGNLPWADGNATGHTPKYAPGGAMSNRVKDGSRRHTKRVRGSKGRGDGFESQSYAPPVLANPGNVLKCNVGGNRMGSKLAHESEAPFPEDLVEPFVRCFCPPGGAVCDPFAGSGTTAAVALKWGRRFVGCDIRESQVELTRRRLAAWADGAALISAHNVTMEVPGE